jgi:hypothetical protein
MKRSSGRCALVKPRLVLTSELEISATNKSLKALCRSDEPTDCDLQRLINRSDECRYAMESAQLACDVAYAGVKQGSVLGGRL